MGPSADGPKASPATPSPKLPPPTPDVTWPIPDLVKLLSSSSPATQAKAAKALGDLAGMGAQLPASPWINPFGDNIRAIVNAGAIPPLVALLSSSDPSMQATTAGLVARLAGDDAAFILAGAIPPLVALLTSSDPKVQAAAAGALTQLAGYQGVNVRAVTEAGAIPPLVALLRSSDTNVQAQAAGAVKRVAEDVLTAAGTHMALVKASAIPALVALLKSSDATVQAAAAGAVALLVWERSRCGQAGEEHLAAVVKAGAIPGLVALLQTSDYDVQFQAAKAVWGLALTNWDTIAALNKAGASTSLEQLLGTLDSTSFCQLREEVKYALDACRA